MIALFALVSLGLFAGIILDSSDDGDNMPDDDLSELPSPPDNGNTTPPGDLIEGDGSSETLTGSNAGESIAGRAGNDEIDGRGGNDRLFGDDGNDSILGGSGFDLVSGGDGNDLLTGADGNDTVLGGEGNDAILEGRGADSISGGGGNDVLLTSRFDLHPSGAIRADVDTSGDAVNGGAGDDLILFGRDDTVTGGDGADEFFAGRWLETTEAATITDFESGEDQIVYGFNPEDGPPPRFSVFNQENEDGGSDAIVLADGVEVLRVLDQDGQFDPDRHIRLFADGASARPTI
ncbi:calcium-binding protein [Phaeobacter gallaeciensis]|uniref:calcium-binding protein n=1 Tax=Phaeobacter gallaeciensis TaxID=60890 RepID=UPI00237F3465|nr:calcium-binding protein [Phaeobacter gallaeciensis]MDE4302738.1 calcium-binding protein [Phaeobacter gallaeciensis]MDE4307169.1 calcium-binding protein [Phaeobacter gallaeciensis]MDE4311634.1 calcium-binding protein [Phaeobacter gallaeciensis]MDE4316059.1 calcium-binding protein [Phaeobacter gallaeciensis]MDE4320561.1 calcium-binding protein [Phaeobacter gallaeciensis]